MEGVYAVVTSKDTIHKKQGIWRRFPELCDEEILCSDKVRYIGDPVAAVAAIDEYTAEEALNLIDVEYEPLPAVFDPLDAIKEDAPKVHEGVELNINVTATSSGAMSMRPSSSAMLSAKTTSAAPHRHIYVWKHTALPPATATTVN